jgi:MFS family permease
MNSDDGASVEGNVSKLIKFFAICCICLLSVSLCLYAIYSALSVNHFMGRNFISALLIGFILSSLICWSECTIFKEKKFKIFACLSAHVILFVIVIWVNILPFGEFSSLLQKIVAFDAGKGSFFAKNSFPSVVLAYSFLLPDNLDNLLYIRTIVVFLWGLQSLLVWCLVSNISVMRDRVMSITIVLALLSNPVIYTGFPTEGVMFTIPVLLGMLIGNAPLRASLIMRSIASGIAYGLAFWVSPLALIFISAHVISAHVGVMSWRGSHRVQKSDEKNTTYYAVVALIVSFLFLSISHKGVQTVMEHFYGDNKSLNQVNSLPVSQQDISTMQNIEETIDSNAEIDAKIANRFRSFFLMKHGFSLVVPSHDIIASIAGGLLEKGFFSGAGEVVADFLMGIRFFIFSLGIIGLVYFVKALDKFPRAVLFFLVPVTGLVIYGFFFSADYRTYEVLMPFLVPFTIQGVDKCVNYLVSFFSKQRGKTT